jgi:hypothetical protein
VARLVAADGEPRGWTRRGLASRRACRSRDARMVVTKRSLSTAPGAREVACRSAIRCEKYEKFCG